MLYLDQHQKDIRGIIKEDPDPKQKKNDPDKLKNSLDPH